MTTDLSITRIAGLTWNEWNARLAMPLVTQLSEGVQPLVFPTDLSINTTTTISTAATTTTAAAAAAAAATLLEKTTNNSNLREQSIDSAHLSLSAITPPIKNERLTDCSSGRSTPYHNKNLSGKLLLNTTTTTTGKTGTTTGTTTTTTDNDDDDDDNNVNDKNNLSKLNHLTEEEATALMLKATAEKGSSGNISDNSYSEENSVVAAAAAAFADAGLCNINILNSISAMNSLIGANNGALSLTSSSSSIGNTAGSGIANSSGGIGHPCPECGRVYKLKSSLRNHQKWECGKEPQFQCPFCVYRAKQKMHIGRHMERMHKEKFVKLEDLKSYSSAAVSGSGGGTGSIGGSGLGGVSGDITGAGPGSSSGHDDAVAELRQHFS